VLWTAIIQINQPTKCNNFSWSGRHCHHHAAAVKPEAATAVVELLMMGVRMPKTC